MPCGISGEMTIDVEPGDLLMHQPIHNGHQLILTSARGILSEQNWQNFKTMAKFIDKMDRSQYSHAISSKNESKNPKILNQPDNQGWFRIQRH